MSFKGRYDFVKPHLAAVFTVVDGVGAALTAAARVLRPLPRAGTPRRILLVDLAHIGDVIMIIPALRAVRAAYPGAHIAALIGPWCKDVLAANPYLDEILVFRPSWWDRDRRAFIDLAQIFGLGRLLRSRRFDLSINFKSFPQENMALWLARIPARVGYGIFGGGFLLTQQIEYSWGAHMIECNMALVDRICFAVDNYQKQGIAGLQEPHAEERTEHRGPRASRQEMGREGGATQLVWNIPMQPVEGASTIQPSTSGSDQLSRRNKPEMYVFDEDIWAANEFLEAELGRVSNAAALSAEPLVAFHIGAGYPSKLWGAEKYAALADELASSWGARLLIVGGPDDVPLIARMQQLSRENLIVAAGKLSIRQTAALISRCSLFVGNDSGPAHIAAAIGVPSIALFSGENEAAVWRPYSDTCMVIQKRPDCSPCRKTVCDREHLCMEEITLSEVVQAAERALMTLASAPEGKKERR